MGPEYYDHATFPSQGAAGSSAAMRSELELIEAGFGKLPTIAGNGGKVLAVNAGATALEAITTTGTGDGVRATSPTLVTPALGAATATTVNKITITQPATGATLTLVEGSTLATSGAYSATLTMTAATNVTLPTTGTLATLAGTETLTNKTLTNPAISSPTGITATNISNTPAGGIAATTVQAALNELDAEKAKSGANSDITSVLSSVSGMVLLSTGTASASATLDFTGLTGYASYLFVLDSVRPATDGAVLSARISTDNGATYKAGGSDYRYSGTETTSAGATGVGSSAGAAQINVGFASVSNNAIGGVSGEVSLVGAASTSKLKRVGFKVGCSVNSAGISASETGEGFYVTDTNAINAMRFLYSAGTIADGSIKCYGIRS